ncbi:MAG TPA: aldehyde dehydrogenase family protein [Polyangiaceae bacterium]|nr:aldehyde dehydrogenase family protein [Polyangiaceae bacterium]
MSADSAEQAANALERLGVPREAGGFALGGRFEAGSGPTLVVKSPIDGAPLRELASAAASQVEAAITASRRAFETWRSVPAPRRGELVRRLAQELRAERDTLAALVTLEVGKIGEEARGEVQEMIDMADFAVGLSRQLTGLTIASERPSHRLTEQWHPLGPIGVITAFNFPVAVWAWNAALALVCGDPVVWKPSEKAPLTALACHALALRAARDLPDVPEGLLSLVVGGPSVGEALARSPQLPLISATGSVRMGRAVAIATASRLGRSLLELGGNNAMIVAPSARLELAVRAALFAAAGTAGQRCTSLRRLLVHESVAGALLGRLERAFSRVPIGDPRVPGTLMGPLIDRAALEAMQRALASAREQGGRVHGGEPVTTGVPPGGAYVRPALVEIDAEAPIVQEETFAPILYVSRYTTLEQAIAWQNGVPQGLASSIITDDLREAERFCSASGSDCGIANVNIGTSGAEIGGAFGGEKETGGGRESGSDAWKSYMRRATNTINYGDDLPLAQGIRFELD